MSWVAASLLSSFFLGCYELLTKHAVRENAVLPVLFLSNCCGALVWGTLWSLQRSGLAHVPVFLVVDPLTPTQHAQILLKSAIVATSWACTYFAVKHLPVSLASPIRAMSPIWTMVGGLTLLSERPGWLQFVGMALTLGSFVALSLAGRREGIHFHRNRWVWWLLAGTIFNAASGLYDKFLLGRAGFRAPTVQCWFALYLVVLVFPFAVGWKLRWWTRHEFHRRWSIPLLACALLVADYIYFRALQDPAALISIVASLRRGSLLVAFAGGLLFFGEENGLRKLPAVLGILAGILLTILG
ncbi:MAG TPA: DMT family transporter [Candidatus Didemnitutus sp.]|nr:DMT family transporter [Candidatus Didemnitutus sp.]